MKDIFNHNEELLKSGLQEKDDDIIVCLKYTCDNMNLYNLAQSYFETAKHLNTDSMHSEWFCYPILFCYRQYLELMLKDLFNKYYELWRYKFLHLSNLQNSPIEILCAKQKKDLVIKIFDDIKLMVKHPNNTFKTLETEINNFQDKNNKIKKYINVLIKEKPQKYKVLNIIKDLSDIQCKFTNLHSLERYIALVSIFIKNTYPDIIKEKDYETFERLILMFHVLDDSSMSFRYPFLKGGDSTSIQKIFEDPKNVIKIKTVFGESEYNKYETVDFKYLKNVFNKIDDYFVYLKNKNDKLHYAYDKIGELVCGNYYSLIFSKYWLSFYDVKQAKKQFDEASTLSKNFKPEFTKILNSYKRIFNKILDMFKKYSPEYKNSSKLNFIRDERFEGNYFASGSLLDKERTKMKKQSLLLRKTYRKYLKDMTKFDC